VLVLSVVFEWVGCGEGVSSFCLEFNWFSGVVYVGKWIKLSLLCGCFGVCCLVVG